MIDRSCIASVSSRLASHTTINGTSGDAEIAEVFLLTDFAEFRSVFYDSASSRSISATQKCVDKRQKTIAAINNGYDYELCVALVDECMRGLIRTSLCCCCLFIRRLYCIY